LGVFLRGVEPRRRRKRESLENFKKMKRHFVEELSDALHKRKLTVIEYPFGIGGRYE
jgi:hypothetical protein